jgi:hypothetical protein
MTLNSIAAKSIPNGTKIVAIYGDGSGASLFFVDDLGSLYNAECGYVDIAPDTYLMDHGFAYWMLLPDSFRMWFELHEEKRP